MNSGMDADTGTLAVSGRSVSINTERTRQQHANELLVNASAGENLPALMTVEETATLLRKTERAIYQMIARAQLPGITRIGRRVYLRRDHLLHWLDHKCAPSQGEQR
jgi:excisionase family DNA binding protein